MQCSRCRVEMQLWRREQQQAVYRCPKCRQEYKHPEKKEEK